MVILIAVINIHCMISYFSQLIFIIILLFFYNAQFYNSNLSFSLSKIHFIIYTNEIDMYLKD